MELRPATNVLDERHHLARRLVLTLLVIVAVGALSGIAVALVIDRAVVALAGLVGV